MDTFNDPYISRRLEMSMQFFRLGNESFRTSDPILFVILTLYLNTGWRGLEYASKHK